jgi:hypothetical protein
VKDPTMKSYEERCTDLADQFAACLDRVKLGSSDELSLLSDMMQAELNLADYKCKFRQADHVKPLSYGPLAISAATFVLALVLAFFSIFQLQQKEQDTQASLVLKVLAAPPEEGKRLLHFLTDAGLLKLKNGQREHLETLLQK